MLFYTTSQVKQKIYSLIVGLSQYKIAKTKADKAHSIAKILRYAYLLYTTWL